MTAFVARLRPQWTAVLGRSAEVAGRTVGAIGRGLPGTLGPGLVAFGVYEIYQPLGFIVAGGILWLFDRQVPTRRPQL